MRQLYGRLQIAEGVWRELNAQNRTWPGSTEVSSADWIEIVPTANQTVVTALRRDLDQGEAETIALALVLNADLVLLDEQDGRFAAKGLG